MAANVETMFSVREKPWHGLGTHVKEAITSKSALKAAGLEKIREEAQRQIDEYKKNLK